MELLVGALLLVLLVRVVYLILSAKDKSVVVMPVALGALAVVVGYLVTFDYHWLFSLVLAIGALYFAWANKSMKSVLGGFAG